MLIRPRDAWTLARLMIGHDLNGELDGLQPPWDRVGTHLAGLPADKRQDALAAVRAIVSDPDGLTLALANADPEGPPPEAETFEEAATLADLRAIAESTPWVWPGWIPGARIVGLAATEGVGKTRLALDLARRLWHGEPWPDGHAVTLPEGTRTLWVCADGQQDDLFETVAAYGLPDHAVILNTVRSDPYGGNTIDDPDDLARLERNIEHYKPGLVFVDSLTYATAFDLCDAKQVKALAAPPRDIAQRTRAPIVLNLHLSREGVALGRRIRGVTRTILQLDAQDPDHPERLKLFVSRSIAKRPPALGVTMSDAGNTYDHNPPTPPESGKAGRPPEAREKAEQFITELLKERNDQGWNELKDRWEADGGNGKTFGRAVDALSNSSTISTDGGKGTGRPMILHLNSDAADSGTES
jgi:hypothetical protein